jgi:hypothetical protein
MVIPSPAVTACRPQACYDHYGAIPHELITDRQLPRPVAHVFGFMFGMLPGPMVRAAGRAQRGGHG